VPITAERQLDFAEGWIHARENTAWLTVERRTIAAAAL
jgi:hypothetical protein